MAGEIVSSVNGDQGRVHYGPRTTDKEATSYQWLNSVKRMLEAQLDGDVAPVVAVDFADDTLQVLPAGSIIVAAYAYSDTGAAVTITPEGVSGALAPIAVAPAAAGWDIVRDLDIAVPEDVQFGITIAAGTTAKVFVEYLHPAEGDGTGVLDKRV
jgi:hypothetical protein